MLCSALLLAAALAAPAESLPAWLTRGSGAFDSGGKRLIYGVGMASNVGHREANNQSSAGAWIAYGRALADLARMVEEYVEKLTKDYQAAVSAEPAPVVDASGAMRTYTSHAFGAVQVKVLVKSASLPVDGGPEETFVSESIKITFRDLELKAYQEATSSADPNKNEESQRTTLGFAEADTGALRDELLAAGVEMKDSWTANDGTISVLLALDFAAAKRAVDKASELARQAKNGRPPPKPPAGPALTEVRAEASPGQLVVSAAIGEDDPFAPTVFWRAREAARFEAAALLRQGARWATAIPVAAWPVEYYVEVLDRRGERLSRHGSPKEPQLVKGPANTARPLQ